MRGFLGIVLSLLVLFSCSNQDNTSHQSLLYLSSEEAEEMKYVQITAYEDQIYDELPPLLLDTTLHSTGPWEFSLSLQAEGKVHLRTASWYGWLYIMPGEDLHAHRNSDGSWVFGEGKVADINRFMQQVDQSTFAYMHRDLCSLSPNPFLDTLSKTRVILEDELFSLSQKHQIPVFSQKMKSFFEDQLYEYLHFYPDYHKHFSGLERIDFPKRDSIMAAIVAKNNSELWSNIERNKIKKTLTTKVLETYSDTNLPNRDSLSWKFALEEEDDTKREFLLASIITDALGVYHYEHALEMLHKFELFFPDSKYLGVLKIYFSQKESIRDGVLMKDFCGIDLQGDQRCLSELKGKVILIDTWATWCGPCIESFPKVFALRDKYQDQGLEILFVNMDDEDDSWRRFASKNPMMGTNQIHIDNAWHSEFSRDNYLHAVPFYVLLDREGKRLHTGFSLSIEGVIENSLNLNMD